MLIPRKEEGKKERKEGRKETSLNSYEGKENEMWTTEDVKMEGKRRC